MRYFIVEDDKSIVNILSRIITERNLGEVVGFALDGAKAVDEIPLANPDVLLVDLFIPGKSGIQIVNELSKVHSEISYVMISSVSSKDMIAKAYESGIEFYIQKPINAIEVESVLKRVNDHRKKTEKLEMIKNMFNAQVVDVKKNELSGYEKVIKFVLHKIGVLGEVGTQDILNVVSFLVTSNADLSKFTIKEICQKYDANPKSVEQRIRRTAMTGMVNLAHLGLEDYLNEVFTEYSSGLYNFSEVKREMDYIRGKSNVHGKVNIRKFIDGLVFYCENDYHIKM
ncbi:response regulator [Acidaminobacter sp. JC074]|uniref:response regulator n=1 Tax=Acidaminobacter sp. JC074 TaxID=2530199 RepID=UPI001F0F843D|nr:response regulator [Acidaminobacter sp. JC074]MCH4889060.1 response regulator [Acidaminobacter sp. JC074]